VIAVGYGRVATTIVITGARDRLTGRRILGANRDDMLVVVAIVWVMQMAVVEIINMPVVHDANVTAVLAVGMRVAVVGMVAHNILLFVYQLSNCTYVNML
jgi:hypothetical protein